VRCCAGTVVTPTGDALTSVTRELIPTEEAVQSVSPCVTVEFGRLVDMLDELRLELKTLAICQEAHGTAIARPTA